MASEDLINIETASASRKDRAADVAVVSAITAHDIRCAGLMTVAALRRPARGVHVTPINVTTLAASVLVSHGPLGRHEPAAAGSARRK
jgi:hypothetical protein